MLEIFDIVIKNALQFFLIDSTQIKVFIPDRLDR